MDSSEISEIPLLQSLGSAEFYRERKRRRGQGPRGGPRESGDDADRAELSDEARIDLAGRELVSALLDALVDDGPLSEETARQIRERLDRLDDVEDSSIVELVRDVAAAAKVEAELPARARRAAEESAAALERLGGDPAPIREYLDAVVAEISGEDGPVATPPRKSDP